MDYTEFKKTLDTLDKEIEILSNKKGYEKSVEDLKKFKSDLIEILNEFLKKETGDLQ